jgi:hypothetical protein
LRWSQPDYDHVDVRRGKGIDKLRLILYFTQ